MAIDWYLNGGLQAVQMKRGLQGEAHQMLGGK